MMKFIVPALLAFSLPFAVWAAPAKTPVAKSQIDARGVAALDKAVAYYKTRKSFAVVATETIDLAGAAPRRTRYELSLQTPKRAALKIIKTAPADPKDKLSFALIDASALLTSTLGQPAQTTPLAGEEERAQALVRLFTPTPSLALSVVSFSIGINPAKTERTTAVRFSAIRDEGRSLFNVVVVGHDKGDPNPIVLEYRLAPQTGELRKFVIRRALGGRSATVVTRFEPIVSNWKGSQKATDGAIYNWKKLAPRIAVAAPKPIAAVSVEPKARALFARAVELYRELNGLSVAWTKTEDDEKTKGSFDFDRAGRVRIVGRDEFESLIVIDGKTKYTLDESLANEAEEVRYTRESLDADSAATDALTALELSFGVADAFFSLLDEYANPLSEEQVTARVGGLELNEFRASILPPQPFGGEPCDRVRITTKGYDLNPYVEDKVIMTEQKTYWFARKDGRLVRYQERTVEGTRETESLDFQVTAQKFNPTFAPNTFKFTPPPGAKLSKE